ncbi:hypothetical protein CEXT_504381 [Caerostris extrusa]|uniref:Uncharacterized protein n=1 Tax=Caerostris extrusa TaxID=172846 RepID=A0AAV4TGZ5_CAEEX|nr:hypothetical protein CEXT_504381 [Caerostris extrusa]
MLSGILKCAKNRPNDRPTPQTAFAKITSELMSSSEVGNITPLQIITEKKKKTVLPILKEPVMDFQRQIKNKTKFIFGCSNDSKIRMNLTTGTPIFWSSTNNFRFISNHPIELTSQCDSGIAIKSSFLQASSMRRFNTLVVGGRCSRNPRQGKDHPRRRNPRSADSIRHDLQR